MRPVTVGERARMRSARAETLLDTCTLLRYTEGERDAHGHAAIAWIEEGPYTCGFHIPRREESMGGAQIPLQSVQFRLPPTVVPDHRDRIQLTVRCGETLDPAATYQVVGVVVEGLSGVVVDAREV